MAYQLLHHRLFAKEILKVPAHHQQKIYQILTQLKANPRQLPPNTTPLLGYKNTYRARIGNLRLIFKIDHSKKQIFVLAIRPRGDIYKLLRNLLS